MSARKAGRRPAHAPTPGRQEIWEAIRKLRSGFDLDAIIAESGAHRKTVQDYMRCLLPAGIVEWREATGLTLANDRGFHAPRLNRNGEPVTQGAGVENMWRSMRGLGEFSPLDIATHSTTPDVSVTLNTAKSYCSMLLKTGYLVVKKKASAQGGLARYRLVRNSGPQPPQIQRVKRVFDPNTGEVYAPEGPREIGGRV